MCYGPDAYFTSGWNIMDGSLVIISIVDLLMSLLSDSSPRIFGILRVRDSDFVSFIIWFIVAGISFIAIFTSTSRHKQSSWFKTRSTNITVFFKAHRKYSFDLLYVFYHIRHFRCSSKWKCLCVRLVLISLLVI